MDMAELMERTRVEAEQLRRKDGGREAPQETGKRLAAIDLGDGEEMRLTWGEWHGRYYLALRVWRKDRGGTWWPCKDRGVTVRASDLPAFVEGVSAAVCEATLAAAQGAVSNTR